MRGESAGSAAWTDAAEPGSDLGRSALTQLRAYLAQNAWHPGTRIPAERDLSELLGVSRGELRKALAVLESRGELWRHVGKGTFVGARPIAEQFSVAALAAQTNPAEVMRARLVIEPELAREAALYANREDIENLRACLSGSRAAETWREYESWDNRLHRTVAEAAHNALLLAAFDIMNAVRRAVVWGRLREDRPRPAPDHHSFGEHDEIVRAVSHRDLVEAEAAMRRHLHSVERHLLNPQAEDDALATGGRGRPR